VNCGDAAVAFEVSNVVREYVADAVNLHRGGEPGVVNLDSFYSVLGNNPSPFGIDGLEYRAGE
jgi:hypothetical protein